MSKPGPPPAAPPSYTEAVGGVAPSSPFTPGFAPHATTIVTTVVPVGPEATHMVCPHCHAEVDTTTVKKPGLIAWISGGLLVVFGCWLGCCLIPCCIPECMDTHHSCPNCKAYLGRHRSY